MVASLALVHGMAQAMSRCRSWTRTDIVKERITCQWGKGHRGTHKVNVGDYTIWWGDGKRKFRRTKR